MIDEHKVFFEWPHSEPTEVIVCGSFNDWARTCHLTKGPTGFSGYIYVPWGSKITYKYIVDGVWSIRPEELTERDENGNINNMYIAPSQPDDNGKPASAEAPGNTAGNMSQMIENSADTVSARENTSLTLDHAASGFGAAMNNSVGVDPTNAEQIAPTPFQSVVTAGTESDITGGSVSDGAPLPTIPAEVPSSQHHVSETPVASEDPKAVPSPEKKASDILVPIVPVSTAEDHTVSTPVAELAITPAEDGIGSTRTAVKVNEDVPVAIEDNTSKVEENLMTVEKPHTTVEKSPAAESILTGREDTSKIVDVPIAAAGDKASLVTSEDPASTPEEFSKEASQVLKTPEAITPASDTNPSLVLASVGIPTAAAPSSTPEEKAMPQDVPVAPIAPLQKELDQVEQTESAPVTHEVKVQPAHSLETSDATAGPEIADLVPEPAAEPQAKKELEESGPLVLVPAGEILASQAPQEAVANATELLVEPQSVKQEKKAFETEAKAKMPQGELTPVSTQASGSASEILPAPIQTTGATTTETTPALTAQVVPTAMEVPVTEAARAEPTPVADRIVENLSDSPVEVTRSAPTPIIQATPLDLGPTSPVLGSEAATEPVPKTEAAPPRSESASTQAASYPVAPSHGHTEEPPVLSPASAHMKKAFQSTESPTASPSKSGKTVPERKKKLSLFGRIKHFFESDKGKSKNKFEE